MIFDQLIALDQHLLLDINNMFTPYWNDVMFIISGKITWGLFYLSLLIALYKSYPKDFWYILIGLVLTLVIADQAASGFLKPVIARWRPSRDPDLSQYVHIVHGYTGGKYGFVSSHAANVLGATIFTIPLFRSKWYTWMMLVWCAVVCYSRMYLGVHYPLDILGGALVGSLSACIVYFILKIFKPHIYKSKVKPALIIPIIVLSFTFLAILVGHNSLLFLG